MPPDAFLRRQIRIERLGDSSPERIENARILLLPGHAFELAIQAFRAPARELADLVDAEGFQIPFDGRTYGPEVSKPARFLLALGARPLTPSPS